jgi:hypothetical protein
MTSRGFSEKADERAKRTKNYLAKTAPTPAASTMKISQQTASRSITVAIGHDRTMSVIKPKPANCSHSHAQTLPDGPNGTKLPENGVSLKKLLENWK